MIRLFLPWLPAVLAAMISPPVEAAGAGGSGAAPACAAEPRADVVARVTPDGDLLLAGGQQVSLVDLRLPNPDGPEAPARDRAFGWLSSLAGAAVTVAPAGPPDRWGRLAATVTIAGSPAIDVAELMVGEGFARVDVGERDGLCSPDVLALEATARARRVGLWAAAGEPLAATDLDGLRAAAGRFVVVEGRLVGVGERTARTYLNFGRDYGRDFAVVVPRRAWQAMKRAGLSAEALTGKTIRVRGTIEMWRSPVMEVLAADAIERIEPAKAVSARTGPARP